MATAESSSLLAALGDARSVLVVSSGLSEAKDTACRSLLTRGPADETVVLAVTYDRSGTEWLDHARDAIGGDPADAHIVDAGGAGDGSTTAGVSAAGPDDLTGMQIALSDAFPINGTGVFCFDSLTSLLQYVEPDDVYRFVNETLGRLWQAGVNVHMHIDPGAHDTETIRSLASLFDAMVGPDADSIPAPTTLVETDAGSIAVATREGSVAEGND